MEDMTRKELKQKAIEMRMRQMSYAEIKEALGVSKSTLRDWLRNLPLGERNIELIEKRKHRQIERYRNSMKAKAQKKLDIAYASVSERIGSLSEREIMIAGLFLYWGEGGKATNSDVCLSNTNPHMMSFFVHWLRVLGVGKDMVKVAVILYSDMDIEKEMLFWSSTLGLPLSQFYKPRIKKSKISSITYKNGFGHGTCLIRYGNKQLWDFILMGIRRLEDMQIEAAFQMVYPKNVRVLGLEPRTKTV